MSAFQARISAFLTRHRATVVLGFVLAFAMVGTAGATAGAMLHLGVSNTASTMTTLSSSVNGTVLQLSNSNTTGGTAARGLGITVPAGRAPIRVNSTAGKATNLDADKLDGVDSTELLRTTGTAADADRLDGRDSGEFLLTTETAADANTLDGIDSTEFLRASDAPKGPLVRQGGNYTKPTSIGGCTVAATWTECAPVSFDVPAGETWTVAIQSDGSFFKFNASTRVRVCTSVRRDTEPVGQDKCANQPTGITLNNELLGVSTNGVRDITGGAAGTRWIVSTLVNPDIALDWFNGFENNVVHTLVTAHR